MSKKFLKAEGLIETNEELRKFLNDMLFFGARAACDLNFNFRHESCHQTESCFVTIIPYDESGEDFLRGVFKYGMLKVKTLGWTEKFKIVKPASPVSSPN